ncbi:hypothetical protein BGZ76_003245 [Entomortierella beljakovae]|nr:hypothetical protein BGZ76_003245 [Entomortierella beljakovae]
MEMEDKIGGSVGGNQEETSSKPGTATTSNRQRNKRKMPYSPDVAEKNLDNVSSVSDTTTPTSDTTTSSSSQATTSSQRSKKRVLEVYYKNPEVALERNHALDTDLDLGLIDLLLIIYLNQRISASTKGYLQELEPII